MKRIKAIAIAFTGLDRDPTDADRAMAWVYVVLTALFFYGLIGLSILESSGGW